MANLTPATARRLRDDLVERGYCVIPGVLPADLLARWQRHTDELFARQPVDPRHRYQGSDFHLGSTRLQQRVAAGQPGHCAQYTSLVDEIVDLPAAWAACRLLGLEHQRPDDTVIVLSKPAGGPPLYWHQDMMNWHHPESCAPWPTRVFLSYYLVDTTRANGCLRAIPGTHRRRIPLHDLLPPAHGPEIQAITDYAHHPAFMDHPDAVDLPVQAGDLVLNDARLLHAAHANTTTQRRTLLLQWHSLFQFPQPPSWWQGTIPPAIRDYDPSVSYPATRIPGQHLQ